MDGRVILDVFKVTDASSWRSHLELSVRIRICIVSWTGLETTPPALARYSLGHFSMLAPHVVVLPALDIFGHIRAMFVLKKLMLLLSISPFKSLDEKENCLSTFLSVCK